MISYYLLATASFQLAPVAEVALLLSTPPLFVLTLRRLQGDAPTRLEIIGAILSVTGIALILAPRLTVMEGFAKAHLFGDALAICAAAMTALYAFTYRQLAIHDIAPEPTSLTFLTFLLGTAVLIGIVWLFSITVSLGNFSGSSLFSFLGLGVLCTAIPSFGFAIVSKRLPSIVTAAISLLIPLFAGIFAYVFLGEKFSSTIVPGSLLVLTGIVIILCQTTKAMQAVDMKSTPPDQLEILKTPPLEIYTSRKEGMMATSDLERLFDDWALAWSSNDSSNDPERVLSLFVDDCVFEDVTFGLIARGKEELRSFVKRAFAAIPDFKYGLRNRFATSQWAVIEWVMSGTHKGDLPGIPATGKSFSSVRGSTILELEAGKIRRESDYWDAATFMKQVGFAAAQ
ncbi:MAG TPA: EamA family transporter [Candidatus Udaeobacter sp.]|nr:EamA family transporter [Candidatus Udaeobacter sp.]